jgi:hypothetical protein
MQCAKGTVQRIQVVSDATAGQLPLVVVVITGSCGVRFVSK